jgi:hypothetical protein
VFEEIEMGKSSLIHINLHVADYYFGFFGGEGDTGV